MSEKIQKIVYTGLLPFSEMVAPEERWKIGDRVESKYDGEAGIIHDIEEFHFEQNVGVIFDYDQGTVAWMGDDEVRKETRAE